MTKPPDVFPEDVGALYVEEIRYENALGLEGEKTSGLPSQILDDEKLYGNAGVNDPVSPQRSRSSRSRTVQSGAP